MTGAALLAALALVTVAVPAGAAIYERPACELKQDPETGAGRADLGLNLCVAGEAGAEANLVFGDKAASAVLDWGQAYGGLFLTPYLSLQARGFWRRSVPRGHDAVDEKTLYTDFAVVQLGNPALHKIRLTSGLVRLPFGIDTSAAPQLYQRLENRKLWASPEATTFVTLDNLRDLKVEMGVAANDWRRRRIAFEDKDLGFERLDRSVSMRATYDISALEGTRLVGSVYGAKNGERRYGAGLINKNHKDDYTDFEWVRLLATPDGQGAPFEQIIRLGYTMHWQGQGRWVAQFDDERNRFRRGILDHDTLLWGHLQLRVGLGYSKDESGGRDSHWFGILGTEADL